MFRFLSWDGEDPGEGSRTPPPLSFLLCGPTMTSVLPDKGLPGEGSGCACLVRIDAVNPVDTQPFPWRAVLLAPGQFWGKCLTSGWLGWAGFQER